MAVGLTAAAATSQAATRNNQKFDLNDVCRLRSNPSLVGHVARTPYDVGEHESLADLPILRYTELPEDDLMSFMNTGVPPKGYVFVCFIEPSHGSSLIREHDLELIDRILKLGETVKRQADGIMGGMIISATTKCTLEPIAFRPVDPLTGDYLHLRFTEKPLSNRNGFPVTEASPSLLYDVPQSELTKNEEFSEGDYIVYRQKLGVIQEIERDAVLLLPTLTAVSPLDPLALEVPVFVAPESTVSFPDLYYRYIGNGDYQWASDAEVIFPGQFILTDISNFGRGDLPPGYEPPTVQAYVLATPPMDIHIDWLCPNMFSTRTEDRGPSSEVLRISTLQGNAVKCEFGRAPSQNSPAARCESTFDIGERVRFRDPANAAVNYGYQPIPADQTFGHDLNIFRIVSTTTEVVVRWQDGSITTEHATSLHMFADGEDELWPGSLVALEDMVEPVLKSFTTNIGPFSHLSNSRLGGALRVPQVGVVQTVDSRERIASVRWYQNPDVELFCWGNVLSPRSSLGQLSDTVTNVSTYELAVFPALSKLLDDLVILAPVSVNESAIAPSFTNTKELDEMAGPCHLSFLSPSTFVDISVYLQSVKLSIINSEWFRNTTTVHASPLRRRYSAHRAYTVPPVDFVGKIVAMDTSGMVTVRLPGISGCRDIQVSLERVLMVINGEDFSFATPLNDSDCTDDEWTTDDNSGDYSDSGEPLHAPPTIIEIGKMGDGDVVMTGVSELNIDESQSAHEEKPAVENTPTSVSEVSNLIPILRFPAPASSPPGFAILEDLPPSDHHFIREDTSGSTATRMRRIRREFETLESSLPPGIFVRSWECRMDLMRVMIIGPEGTPYEHAPFVIDVHFTSDFPNRPPSTFFHSWTTGQGPVNPNLYEDGKICLSILGTWLAQNPNETWSPKDSTILQILVSIMGLVLVKAPFYNEAGYEVLAAEDSRRTESSQYTEKAFLMTRCFILHALEHPVIGLEDVLTWHYLPDSSSARPQLLRRAIHEAQGMIVHHHRTSLGQNDQETEASAFLSRLSLGAVSMLRRHVTALEKLEVDLSGNSGE